MRENFRYYPNDNCLTLNGRWRVGIHPDAAGQFEIWHNGRMELCLGAGNAVNYAMQLLREQAHDEMTPEQVAKAELLEEMTDVGVQIQNLSVR